MKIKTINITNREETLEILEAIKNKNYGNVDVRISNIHLKKLNSLTQEQTFKKNDAFISADTLWAIMQDNKGSNKQHNYHGISAPCVWKILNVLKDPYCILKTKQNRYTILSAFEDDGVRHLTIIEVDAPLKEDKKAKINKIVTIYPKDRINSYLKGKTILYIKIKK